MNDPSTTYPSHGKSLKVAHLISRYLPSLGGAQVCIHNIVTQLKKKGIESVVITTTRDPFDTVYDYPVIRISGLFFFLLIRYPRLGSLLLSWKLSSLQNTFNFDIWQVTVGYPIGIHTVKFFQRKNLPCVLRCTGEDIQVDKDIRYGYRLNPEIDRAIRETYPEFDGLVALTDSVREEYLKINILREKIRIIPNGVSLERFSSTTSPPSLLKHYHLEKKKILLTVGRNHPKKGYYLIPSILEHLLVTQKDVVWIIIGKGCKGSITRFNNGIEKHIILIDQIDGRSTSDALNLPTDELLSYFKFADIFVLPTFIETFGMVLIEANAAGLPVVTSDVLGCRDVIEHNFNGLLSTPGDVKAYAQNILSLLQDAKLYNTIHKNALLASKKYDWHLVAEQYLKFYEDVIEHKANNI